MHFNGRKKKNTVSSTKSADNGLGFSTFNDILGSRSSSPEISRSFARNEINRYFSDDGNSSMGDSTQFMLLTDMGSVQGEPEPPISPIPRVHPGANNVNPPILSTRDLDTPHESHVESFHGDLDSYIMSINTDDFNTKSNSSKWFRLCVSKSLYNNQDNIFE